MFILQIYGLYFYFTVINLFTIEFIYYFDSMKYIKKKVFNFQFTLRFISKSINILKTIIINVQSIVLQIMNFGLISN